MDIVDIASKALQPLREDGITVQEGWYSADMHKMHVTLYSLGDYEGGHSDDDPELDIASIQVNIWSKKNQQSLKNRIRKLMKKNGFLYMGSNDDWESDTGIYNNAMRFMYAEEAQEREE